ncbi:hypothetical protein D3C71_1858120 [compost metagenome]
MGWQRQGHGGAVAGLGTHVDPRANECGALAHDLQTDMRFVGRVQHVESRTVVAHTKAPACALDHIELNVTRSSVLAHVGKRFLQHVQHLHLHVGRERKAVAFDVQLG